MFFPLNINNFNPDFQNFNFSLPSYYPFKGILLETPCRKKHNIIFVRKLQKDYRS